MILFQRNYHWTHAFVHLTKKFWFFGITVPNETAIKNEAIWFGQWNFSKCVFFPEMFHAENECKYRSFERLGKLAREKFASVWSLRKVFVLKNLVKKSLRKIWSENTQKRRPRGSLIKHGDIRPAKFGQMCPPLTLQVYLLRLSEL